MFVLLATFGLVVFLNWDIPSHSEVLIEKWWGFFFFFFLFQKGESTKVSVPFADVKGYFLRFERRFNPDRSNLFNVLKWNWKGYYLIKKNTVNPVCVSGKEQQNHCRLLFLT